MTKPIRPMPIVGVYEGVTVRASQGHLYIYRVVALMRAPEIAEFLRTQSRGLFTLLPKR